MNSLADLQLITNEISIKNNNLAAGQFSVSPTFTRKMGKTSDNKYFTELTIEMKDKEEARFPIDLRIRLTGIFDLSQIQEDQIDSFLKIQAVQILFPYLRTMVSNITASSLMSPIVLPVIDVLKMFPEDQQTNN